jgi:hypothetical protein
MVDALTGENYYRFDSLRMVWPNQDYFDLTWSQVTDALCNCALRNAIFYIWYNRNYSFYATLQGKSGLNLYDWNPGDRMRLYIHKDVALKVWEYNILQQNSLEQNP